MKQNIDKAIEIFRDGGVVIFPTDTAIGIGCIIDDENAVRRVYEIKKRDYKNPLLVLVDSIKMAEKYVEIPDDVKHTLLTKYWPGGLTVFFKCNLLTVPSIVRSGTNTLAVRFPDHKEIIEVINKVGVPIIATSANISGKETPYKISDVDNSLRSQVDFVMEGKCTFEQQSTIIDTTVAPWKIIREGAVKIQNL